MQLELFLQDAYKGMDSIESIESLIDFLGELAKSGRYVTSRDALWLERCSGMLGRYRDQVNIVPEYRVAIKENKLVLIPI